MGCLEREALSLFPCEGLCGSLKASPFYFWKGGDVMEWCPDCGSQLLHLEGCTLCPCCGYSACECNECNGLTKGVENVLAKD